MNATLAGIAAASLAAFVTAQPGSAAAQSSPRVITVPPGAMVVVLPSAIQMMPATSAGTAFAPADMAVIRRLVADMDGFMAMPMALPDPAAMLRAAMDAAPAAGGPPGSVVFTAVSTGDGACRQTIRYGAPGPDGRAAMQVSRSGDACDRLMPTMPVDAAAPAPAPVPAPETVRPRGTPQLWTVSTDRQALQPPAHPRT